MGKKTVLPTGKQPGAEGSHLLYLQLVGKGAFIGNIAHPGKALPLQQGDIPAVGMQYPQKALDNGGFTRSVFPDQPLNGTAGNGKGHFPQR